MVRARRSRSKGGMPTGGQNRRVCGAGMLAAAVGAPAAVRAQRTDLMTSLDATRLKPSHSEGYFPPTRLSAVLDIYKRMTAPALVAGGGPFPFVVDTGANQSVISTELADKLGLARSGVQQLNGVAGVQLTQTVVTSIQVGGRPAKDMTFSVLPAATMGGMGMLGLDLIGGARLTLDFFHQQVTIDEGPPLPGGGDAFQMRAHRRDGALTLVDANLAGIPVTAFLDSGAQDTIGNMALRELAITRYPTTPWRPIPIVSVTGQTVDA